MIAVPHTQANAADFLFRVEDSDAELRVLSFDGSEGLSELFSFRLELCCDEPVQLDTMLGARCTLEIHGDERERYVNGIVRRFERTGSDSVTTRYTAEIVPRHWLLTRRTQSRIFLKPRCEDMSVPGIVRKVFLDAGLREDSFRFALSEGYDPREFVVQYRESDWNFVAHLLEEEGLYFFFEHTADEHRLVITDSDIACQPADGAEEIPYRVQNGLVPERSFVYDLRDAREIHSGAVSLDDFDFKRPAFELLTAVSGKRFSDLSLSDYPGGYFVKKQGQRYTQRRLEQQQCQNRVVRLDATVRTLMPGRTFTLTDHADSAVNREYVITRVVHSAKQPQSTEQMAPVTPCKYRADVRAIPSDVPYRPPLRTPRPTVLGSQTAIVVGPDGEEIYTDEYGRVKVQFHWDHEGGYDQNSSCWIRVSQGLAGGGYGMMFLPRIGQEVIVDFLEGNPNCPIVTGRVYNNDHLPPYKLPEEKTKSVIKTRSSKDGGGSNEIRFEDAKDEEQFLIYGHKDFHLRAGNDRAETIGRDRHLTVGNDRVEQVKRDWSLRVDRDRMESIGRDHSLAVAGMVSIQVDGTHSTEVTRDVVEKFKASHRHDVKGTYALKGANLRLEGTEKIELKCGGSSIVLTPNAIFITGGPLVNINSGAGPSVVSPTTVPTPPAKPTPPLNADTVSHGRDTRYGAQADEQKPVEESAETLPANDEKMISWIEIELVNEVEEAVPGERYEIRLPDGEITDGRLDANGFARVDGIEPGTGQICFPDLDAEAWERI